MFKFSITPKWFLEEEENKLKEKIQFEQLKIKLKEVELKFLAEIRQKDKGEKE